MCAGTIRSRCGGRAGAGLRLKILFLRPINEGQASLMGIRALVRLGHEVAAFTLSHCSYATLASASGAASFRTWSVLCCEPPNISASIPIWAEKQKYLRRKRIASAGRRQREASKYADVHRLAMVLDSLNP